MEPAQKQHKKIMCTSIDRKPEQCESLAIRFEDATSETKLYAKGFLDGYYQVQIDHSEN